MPNVPSGVLYDCPLSIHDTAGVTSTPAPRQNTCMKPRGSTDCTNPQVVAPKFLRGNKRTDLARTRYSNPRAGAAVAMCQPFSGVASSDLYVSIYLAGQAGTVLCDVDRLFENAPLGR